MNKLIKNLRIFLVVLVLVLLVMAAGWIFKIIFISQAGATISRPFEIKSGQSFDVIAANLDQANLIENQTIFKAYMGLRGLDKAIKIGFHNLPGNLSLQKLANALISGNTITNEMTIQIKEGWDLRDIAHYLNEQGLGKTEDFYKITGYPAFDYRQENDLPPLPKYLNDFSFLKDKPSYISIEGYLFPDTYRVYKNTSMEDIAIKMLDNFSKKLSDELRAEIKKQNKSIFEIVTLASIVEKESDSIDNMPKVAGVYYNRLNGGMRLQSDPTVNYVTLKTTDRPTLEDLEVVSPYNTYRNDGLPLGPICNPSLAAIKAAIYPEKNDYYFFLNTPDGQLIFSKTFEEHKANREKYFND